MSIYSKDWDGKKRTLNKLSYNYVYTIIVNELDRSFKFTACVKIMDLCVQTLGIRPQVGGLNPSVPSKRP